MLERGHERSRRAADADFERSRLVNLYEITGADVGAAYTNTTKAAAQAGQAGEVRERIRRLVATETHADHFVTRILGRELSL